MGQYGLDSSGSGEGPEEGSCEDGNELLDCIKCEFLEQLSDLRLAAFRE